MIKNYTKSFAVVLFAFTLLFPVGCGRLRPQVQPDETAQAFRNRSIAIHMAQIATFLNGGSDAIVLLNANNVVGNNSTKLFINTENKVADAWLLVKTSLERGVVDAATREKVKEILKLVKDLNTSGVIPPSDPAAKIEFAVFIDNLTLFAETLYDLVKGETPGTVDTAQFEKKMARTNRAIKIPIWLPSFGLIVTNTFSRAARQSALGTSEAAYSDGLGIIIALKEKNLDFLRQLG